jgi:hypothetical protein
MPAKAHLASGFHVRARVARPSGSNLTLGARRPSRSPHHFRPECRIARLEVCDRDVVQQRAAIFPRDFLGQ